jgi:hypothetical protein
MTTPACPALSRLLRLVLLAAAAAAAAPALAQFANVPAPALTAPPAASEAEAEKDYRRDAARHIYNAYGARLFRGKLPPLLYSVMVVETEIDATGQVREVSVVRKPAAPEVAPWVLSLIRAASPFPPPAKMAGATVRYVDVWLVDRSGRFQLDTLTEGQR